MRRRKPRVDALRYSTGQREHTHEEALREIGDARVGSKLLAPRREKNTTRVLGEKARRAGDRRDRHDVLDCGGGEKLERWGRQILVRPDPQAIWETPHANRGWKNAQGRYHRSSTGGGHWDKEKLPEQWQMRYRDLTFQCKPMNFKHTGLFPEQAVNWDFAREKIEQAGRPIRVLNLFAYTGAASVACAKSGASVCHVDAAKGMVAWAKENAKVSGLADAPIRWIVDDCAKFVERDAIRSR